MPDLLWCFCGGGSVDGAVLLRNHPPCCGGGSVVSLWPWGSGCAAAAFAFFATVNGTTIVPSKLLSAQDCPFPRLCIADHDGAVYVAPDRGVCLRRIDLTNISLVVVEQPGEHASPLP